jgi:hypothetical protein
MSEQKSGSDLDVFEGLAKKSTPPDEPPPAHAPPAAAPVASPSKPILPPLARHKTLLGMPMPGSFPGSTRSPSVLPNARSTGAGMRRSSIPAPPGARPSVPAPSLPPPSLPGSNTNSLSTTSTGRRAVPARFPGSDIPPPPVLPMKAPKGSNVDVEMDWDEDEKTSVFEKPETTTVYEPQEPTSVFQAGSLRALEPVLPATPPPGTVATPTPTPAWSPAQIASAQQHIPGPPAAPVARNTALGMGGSPPASSSLPGGRTSTATSGIRVPAQPAIPIARGSVTKVMRAPGRHAPPSKRNRYLVVGAGALVVAGIAYLSLPKAGKVAVFAAGSGGKSLSSVTIFVDGVQKCATAPCNLDLEKGVHVVRAVSDGYITQEQGATVRSGEELAINFKLDKASAGTGVRVDGKQDGVELFVDGKEIGPLPQEVKDLAPGAHKVLLKGSDRYVPEERTISLDADELKDLGTVSLKVARGLATFDVRTPGVKVTLVSGRDRRQLTDFTQPVEIETSKNWTVEAVRPGFEDFRLPITFENRAEKTFVIALQERGRATAEPAAAAPAPRVAPEPRQAEPRQAEPVAATNPAPEEKPVARPAAAPSGNCTLNFNSLPVSNILLDGRPIGGTPKLGVSASAGSHTVMFVSADQGKKVTSVTCRAGESKTVAIRFSQ